MQVVAASAPLRRSPDPGSPLETEALYGETVMVYDENGEWAWAQLDRDKYVGYLPLARSGRRRADASGRGATHPRLSRAQHQASAAHGAARSARGSRSWPTRAISRSRTTACVSGAHLAELGAREPDFVAVAERFLETPYLWGGRTSEGIDCSGLVQTALDAAGIAAPRDSDMQEAALGGPVAVDEPRRRGDLVFWKGHVGVMRDPRR